jgi:hypothetical protein
VRSWYTPCYHVKIHSIFGPLCMRDNVWSTTAPRRRDRDKTTTKQQHKTTTQHNNNWLPAMCYGQHPTTTVMPSMGGGSGKISCSSYESHRPCYGHNIEVHETKRLNASGTTLVSFAPCCMFDVYILDFVGPHLEFIHLLVWLYLNLRNQS